MYPKAILKYFYDINIFNLTFSLIFGLLSGYIWSLIIFSSIGILIGFLGFQTFKKNEYYTYHNLGYTKSNLLMKVWLLNVLISGLLFIPYIIFK